MRPPPPPDRRYCDSGVAWHYTIILCMSQATETVVTWLRPRVWASQSERKKFGRKNWAPFFRRQADLKKKNVNYNLSQRRYTSNTSAGVR